MNAKLTGLIARFSPIGHYLIPETVLKQQKASTNKSDGLYGLVKKVLDFGGQRP